MFNYRNKTNVQTPNIIGPDNNLQNNNFNTGIKKNSVSFWTRTSKETGLEEQKLMFEQEHEIKKFFASDVIYKVRIEIVQRFSDNNSVETEITYANTGNQNLGNFIGYTFRNLTFNNSFNNKIISKNAEIRSLGNNRGLFAFNKDLGTNIEFDLASQDSSPFAWKLSSNKPSYFNGSKSFYKNNSEANFKNIFDQGYKTSPDPGIGQSFPDPKLKTIMMATKDKPLNIGDTTKLVYSTKFNVTGKMQPNIKLNNDLIDQKPIFLENNVEKFLLKGSWFDYKSTHIDFLYTIDDNNTNAAKPLFSVNQTELDRDAGINHDWQKEINISNLTPGLHRIRLLARSFVKNEDGSTTEFQSETHQVEIYIKSEATTKPYLSILAPASDTFPDSPYQVSSDKLNISGFWLDSDSKKGNLYYQLDKGKKVLFSQDAPNVTPGRPVQWHLKNLSIAHISDTDFHTLTIYVDDGTGSDEGFDFFLFHRTKGLFRIVAPDSIDFGTIHATNKQHYSCRANLPGSLGVIDYRPNKQSPLTLSLETGELIYTDTEKKEASSLKSSISYKNQFVPNGGKIIIGNTKINTGSSNITWTDFTDHVENNLILNFKHPNIGLNSSMLAKKYQSSWRFVVIETNSI
ncbi:hypothetical protein [Companilactobacillus furfuricola]|uniref:hypothetical protein n=1 Tax=Companilactobacillus furfuricola TaxID=1462575 RepID=UPI000F78380E|nr:hypothetical protein [Companilactobacillus furfuricola]